jgi:hypothetical protein
MTARSPGTCPRVRGRLKRNGIRDRVAQDMVMLAASGAIRSARTFERDLRGELQRIRAEHERSMGDASYRHSGVRALVERNIKLLEKALRDPKLLAQKDRIVAEGERLGRQLNAGDEALLRARVLDSPEQAKRRRLLEVAISHAGARHVTVEEHARLERDAAARERAAHEQLQKSERTAAERPQTAWFRPRGTARDSEPGRGFIDAKGRLHTWNESEGAHADVQRAGGHESIADLIIRRDGTVFPTGGVARPGRALLIAEPEAVARAVAQDSRLKPSKAMAEDPKFQKALERVRGEYANADLPKLRRDAQAAREERRAVSGASAGEAAGARALEGRGGHPRPGRQGGREGASAAVAAPP